MENSKYVKQGSTLILRAVVLCLAAPVVAFALFMGYNVITDPEPGYYTPVQTELVLSTAFIFFALYQIMKLLNYIDQNKAFSDLSVKAISKIKFSALGFSLLYTLSMPYIFYAADRDDAPGVVLIGLIFVFVSGSAAVFAAVLQRLLKDALQIKSENDLTV